MDTILPTALCDMRAVVRELRYVKSKSPLKLAVAESRVARQHREAFGAVIRDSRGQPSDSNRIQTSPIGPNIVNIC